MTSFVLSPSADSDAARAIELAEKAQAFIDEADVGAGADWLERTIKGRGEAPTWIFQTATHLLTVALKRTDSARAEQLQQSLRREISYDIERAQNEWDFGEAPRELEHDLEAASGSSLPQVVETVQQVAISHAQQHSKAQLAITALGRGLRLIPSGTLAGIARDLLWLDKVQVAQRVVESFSALAVDKKLAALGLFHGSTFESFQTSIRFGPVETAVLEVVAQRLAHSVPKIVLQGLARSAPSVIATGLSSVLFDQALRSIGAIRIVIPEAAVTPYLDTLATRVDGKAGEEWKALLGQLEVFSDMDADDIPPAIEETLSDLSARVDWRHSSQYVASQSATGVSFYNVETDTAAPKNIKGTLLVAVEHEPRRSRGNKRILGMQFRPSTPSTAAVP